MGKVMSSGAIKNYIKWVANKFIQWRFLIAIITLFFIMLFKLNGSSIGAWDQIITEKQDTQQSSVLVGKARWVRSDEWNVQTPFYLSQAATGNKVINNMFTPDGQNMIIAYNSPVKDLTVIGKPFNWGFLFLSRDYGLSWYWGVKLIGLFLLAFEMGLILTKHNRYLALIAAFWITLSPAVMWWFMQHVGDLVYFTLAILVGIYNYFYYYERFKVKLAMLLLTLTSVIGFVLVIYPAHQVMFGYFILFNLIAYCIHFWGKVKLKQYDWIMWGIGILAVIGILGHFVLRAWPALKIVLNTAYPGKRISIGGGGTVANLALYLTNWLIPFRDVNFLNNCEISLFYNFFPVILLCSPFIFYRYFKENIIGFMLLLFTLFNLLWQFIQFPNWFAKVSLLSYVTYQRALLTFSFGAMLLSIWFINYIWEHKPIKFVYLVILSILIAGYYVYTIYHTPMVHYFGPRGVIVSVVSFTLIVATILFRKKWLFAFVMLGVILISSITVNPINVGTRAIYNKVLTQRILKIAHNDPKARWIGEGQLSNFIPGLGVKSFNATVFTPDLKTLRRIDKSRLNETIYNRYAHQVVNITNLPSSFHLDYPDQFTLNLNQKQLPKFNIDYIVGKTDLVNLTTVSQYFKLIYGPDKDGYRIYRVISLKTEK